MVRRVDTPYRRFLSGVRVTTRDFIRRFVRDFSIFFRRANAFFRKGTYEAVTTFMGNITKDLIARGFSISIIVRYVLRRVSCVTVMNCKAKSSSICNVNDRPMNFERVKYSVLCPPLTITNFCT